MLGSYDIMGLHMCRERWILEPLFHSTNIAGNVINTTIAITSENCTDEKYKKSSLLRKLEEEVTIFNKTKPILGFLFNIYLFIFISGSETDVLTVN